MLEFDPAPHVYRWNGVVVPSVTQVLAPLTDYSMIPADTLERARQEGVQIHKLIELDCKGDLDTDSLPEWILPYWSAWTRFKDESGFEMVASECQMYHHTFQYAGTCDLVGLLPKLKNAKGLALIDVKRSLYGGPVIGLQLAAYADQWDNAPGAKAPRIKHRFAFQPRRDGTYRLEPFIDPADRATFLALLTVFKWRQKHATK